MRLFKHLGILTKLTYICLNKFMSKCGKRIILIFLHALHKAQGMSESLFFHSLIATFSFSFVSNITNFFIHSFNRFVLKKLCMQC